MIAQSSRRFGGFFDQLRLKLDHRLASIRDARARRGVYLEAMYELSALSDRDLLDLGIARDDIPRLAFEGAYGR